jgi:pimeloyl-ACP methyl ester carboxylesterase
MTSQQLPPVSFFETDDGRLAYREAGSGEPIVLLHGGFLDGRMWDYQVGPFAGDLRVIVPDARGHGDSANATRPFRPADDVAELLRRLGIGRAVLVGVSMGAATAVDVALEHPELARALVISGAGTSEPDFQDGWSANVLGEFWQQLLAGDVEGAIVTYTKFGAGPQRTADELSADVVTRLREMTLKTIGKHSPGEQDQRVLVADTWRRAAGIKVPVLAVIGELDSDDHRRMATRLAESVADGRVATIPGTAHYPNLERPEEFNQRVIDFVAALPA